MALKVIEVGRIAKDNLELVRLQGIKRGSLPRWWQQIWEYEKRYLGGRGGHWYDHVGRDGETLIAEPYDLFTDDLKDIMSLCDRYNLDVEISATSQHFPTQTVCIRLSPRKRS